MKARKKDIFKEPETQERYVHQTKTVKTIHHKHPKRIKTVRTLDYGNVQLTETLTYPPETDMEITDKLHNPEKISFGKIGNLEFYAYPKHYPDLFFMGKGKKASIRNWRDLYSITAKIRWYYGLKIGKKKKRM